MLIDLLKLHEVKTQILYRIDLKSRVLAVKMDRSVCLKILHLIFEHDVGISSCFNRLKPG